MTGPSARTAARSMTFCNSRTFPGQAYPHTDPSPTHPDSGTNVNPPLLRHKPPQKLPCQEQNVSLTIA